MRGDVLGNLCGLLHPSITPKSISNNGELYNEEDMAAWYGPAAYSPQSKPHHTNMLDSYVIFTFYLILSNFGLYLHTLIHANQDITLKLPTRMTPATHRTRK